MPGSGYSESNPRFGTSGVNYLETDFFYDPLGRLYSTHNPDGTVQETFYDVVGDVTAVWQGSSDVPDQTFFPRLPGDGDPNPDRATSAPGSGSIRASTSVTVDGMNMYEVSTSTYDADGDLLSTTALVDSSAADNRTTRYVYDSQDREIAAINPADGAPASGSGRVTYTLTTYDNLGEAIETQQYLYQGSDLSADIAAAQGESAAAPLNAADTLLSQTNTAYDSLGQVYQTTEYATVANNSVSSLEITNYWYDARGNEVQLERPQRQQHDVAV